MSNLISLELLNERHIDELVKIANNSEISKTSGVPLDCNEKMVREWLQENKNPLRLEITFVVIVKSEVAGCCIFKKVDMLRREAELAYWLGVDYWGKGITTDAASMLCSFAFDFLNFDALHSHYLKFNNVASGRVLTKLGFVKDDSRQDMPVSDRFIEFSPDVWTFVTLTRESWLAAKTSKSWSIVPHQNDMESEWLCQEPPNGRQAENEAG